MILFFLITFLILIENILYFYIQFKKYKIINASSYVLCFMLITYIIFPITYFMGTININEMYKVSFTATDVNNLHIIANALVLVFYTMFFLGYFSKRSYIILIQNNMNEKTIKNYTMSLLIISIFSFFIFLYLYGGIDYVLQNISQIRSGTDEAKSHLGAFFKMFSKYLLIVLLIYFYYYNNVSTKYIHNIKFAKTKFFILFFLSMSLMLMSGGRGGVISIAIAMFILYNIQYKSIKWKYILPIVIFALFIIFFGKTIIFQLFTGQEIYYKEIDTFKYFNKFLLEFAYPYISLINALYLDLGADRLFFDFFAWMFKLLKLFGVDEIDSVSYYNTYHLLGIWDSNVPPGIVAYLYIEGGIFFIPIGAFVFGIFFSYMDKIIYHLSFSSNPILLAITVIMITQFARLLQNSDFALVIQSLFVYLILIFHLYIFKYIKIHIKKRYD